LFLFFSCAFLLLTSGEAPHSDGRHVYITTQSLVDRGTLAVPEVLSSACQINPPSHYAVYPLGSVLAHVPDYLLYKLLSEIRAVPAPLSYALTPHLSSALLMAGACVLLFVALRRQQLSVRGALACSSIFGFATLSYVQSRSPYSEVLQTFALVWTTERALASARQPSALNLALLGTAAGVLINSKVVFLLVLPLYALYLLDALDWRIRHNLLGLLAALGTFSLFLALCLLDNHIKTGSWRDFGYHHRDGNFSGDLVEGLFGLLLSTGKGFFWYSPPLLLAFVGLPLARARWRRESWLLLSVLAVVLLAHAKFRYWNGDWGWGPRYLGPLCPLVIMLAAPWIDQTLGSTAQATRRWALATLVALGVSVNILGATIYPDVYIRVLEATSRPPFDQDCPAGNLTHGHFIPAFSPLVGHIWILKHVMTNDPSFVRDLPFRQHLHGAAPPPALATMGIPGIDWWAIRWLRSSAPAARYGASAAMALLLLGLLVSARSSWRALQRAS
jgi:hypothetical protein